jgi:PadR family transcriptional regulator PadR
MEEIQDATKKFQKEIVGGISSLVLLSVLGKAGQPMYGYQIAKLIESGSDDGGIIKQGALYPVLRSLESSSLLSSEVEPSVSGPPRRYYRITGPGRRALEKWTEIWRETQGFVETILAGGAR